MGTSINFNEKKGFICDMDGVIYHGNRILPGVAEFIDWLHEEDKEYLFLTNNSGYTPRELNRSWRAWVWMCRRSISTPVRWPPPPS